MSEQGVVVYDVGRIRREIALIHEREAELEHLAADEHAQAWLRRWRTRRARLEQRLRKMACGAGFQPAAR